MSSADTALVPTTPPRGQADGGAARAPQMKIIHRIVQHRGRRYSLKLGWDSTQWVNAHVPHHARVAIRHLVAYPWFLRPDVLRGSESREERQRLYEATGRAEGGAVHPAEWELLSRWGFAYAVVESRWLDDSLAAVPAGMARPDVAFEGRETLVLRLR